MKIGFIIAAGALLASTSVVAQSASEDEKSTQELICQLSGDCDGFKPESLANDPDSRGFKIARRTASNDARTAPTLRNTRNRPQVVAEPSSRAVKATSPGRNRTIAAPSKSVAAPGRADLRVSFVTGSAALTDAGKRQALNFVRALASPSLAGKTFRIEGHTDKAGGREYNLDLSKRRAEAVVDFLTAHGADRSRFQVQGYGFDKPVSANAAENRRVEVVLVK